MIRFECCVFSEKIISFIKILCTMKELYLFVSFTSLLSLISFGQNTDRISTIKSMYSEANRLETSQGGVCDETSEVVSDDPWGTGELVEFTNTYKRCDLGNGYVVFHAEEFGYEASYQIHFYLKDNQLFFAYEVANAECCSDESRVYYAVNGTILKLLERTNDCECQAEFGENIEQKDKALILENQNRIGEHYQRIKAMFDY